MPNEPDNACFVDTNIWLYAFLENESNGENARKSAIARKLIRENDAIVSTQVINEVCVNLLRQANFTEEQISNLIEAFYKRYPVKELSKAVLLLASQLRQRYSLSFWDSTIVAAALSSGAGVLYSEDMQHGLMVEGYLEIRNPFIEK